MVEEACGNCPSSPGDEAEDWLKAWPWLPDVPAVVYSIACERCEEGLRLHEIESNRGRRGDQDLKGCCTAT